LFALTPAFEYGRPLNSPENCKETALVDVFSEVDEELRREKLKRFWKKFGPYIIGGVVLFIGAMGGRVYWNDYVNKQRIAESEQYHEALSHFATGDADGAMAALEKLAVGGKYGYDLLASLQLASHYAASGDQEKALQVYDTIAANGSLENRFRDFASLMTASILLDQNAGQDVFDRLEVLAEGDGAWRYSAREMLGLAYFRERDWQQAGDIFSAIMEDSRAPPDLQKRASEFMEMIETQKPAEDLFHLGAGNDPLADGEESVAEGDEPEDD